MSAAIAVMAAATVAATGYAVYSGEQQKRAQANAANQQRQYNDQALAQASDASSKQLAAQESALAMQEAANKKAEASALKQEKIAEERLNAAMRKTPDTGAILSSAEQAAKSGVGGTMLTGPSGVDPTSLTLEKKTLLGG